MNYKIVIPVLNESKYIKKLLEVFPKKHIPNLIFVDDGSRDKTSKIIQDFDPKITVVRHNINLGKGRSLETGALKAIQEKADVIIFMDGDLQHRPEDIDRFLKEFKENPKLKIVFGARSIGRHMRFAPFFGNKVLTVAINLFFKYMLNDTQCGFRAIKSDIFNEIRWTTAGYAAETEMIINAAKHKLKYTEIPIDTIYLENYKGTSFIDGIIIMFKIISWRLFKWKL